MGFWHRLLGLSDVERIINSPAIGTPTPRLQHARESRRMDWDPRDAAQALQVALDKAAALGFTRDHEVTVDDIDFDFYGGPAGFSAEALTALFRLQDSESTPIFHSTYVLDPECVESNEAYEHILHQIAAAAGTRERFTHAHCDLHFGPGFKNNPIGKFSYHRDDDAVHLNITVEGEWIDPEVIRRLFTDATPEGHRWVHTGDYGIHAWVQRHQADELAQIFASEDAAAETRIAGNLKNHRHAGHPKI